MEVQASAGSSSATVRTDMKSRTGGEANIYVNGHCSSFPAAKRIIKPSRDCVMCVCVCVCVCVGGGGCNVCVCVSNVCVCLCVCVFV